MVDILSSMAKETMEEIHYVTSLLYFIASEQQGMLGALPEAVVHLLAYFLQTYVGEGILVDIRLPWPRQALEHAIANGYHASACTPEMIWFIHREMQHRAHYGFRILLPVVDAVHIFGEKLKISHITAVSQVQLRPRFILNLRAKPDKGTPSVNDTTNKCHHLHRSGTDNGIGGLTQVLLQLLRDTYGHGKQPG